METENPELIESPEADGQYLEAVETMRLAKRGKVRVRVLTQLYSFGETQRYKNWKGVIWRLDLEPTVIAGSNFRTALATFFEAVTTIGPLQVIHVLQQASTGALRMSPVEPAGDVELELAEETENG